MRDSRFTLRMNLRVVINSPDERVILENLKRCNNILNKRIKIIFWNDGIIETDVIQDFITRNSKILFGLNTKVTKSNESSWFLIDTFYSDKSPYRYLWHGSVLEGIVKFSELTKHIMKKEEE